MYYRVNYKLVKFYLRRYVQKLTWNTVISKQLASFLAFMKIMICFKSKKNNAFFQLHSCANKLASCRKKEENDLVRLIYCKFFAK